MSINDVICFQSTPIFYHKSNIFSNIVYSLFLGTTIKMRRIYVLNENKVAPKSTNK